MGDISTEPSMEEILSSIKRIIAEEGEGARTPARKPQRTPVPIARTGPRADEVLELSEPIPTLERASPPPEPVRNAEPVRAEPAPAEAPCAEPIVSQEAAAASRGALDTLTRLIVKPESPAADNTLEGLVREMLRPMLREWLDARLPEMVEAMVAREIERITGSR